MGSSGHGVAYRRGGHGPPVVLLHGIPGSGASWGSVMTALGDRFDVVVPDLVGFGASVRPPKPTIVNVGPAAQAQAVAALLDELAVSHATVVGHDFGVPVALLLAAARPELVGALSLLAGNAFPDTPIPFPLSLATVPVVGGVMARVLFSGPSLAMMLKTGTGPGAAPPDAAVHLGDGGQRRTIRAIFHGALTHLEELYGPVAEALGRLDVPVLVGWGDHDPFFPVAQAERTAAVANARLRVFPGAGHFLPHERPSEIALEVAALALAGGR